MKISATIALLPLSFCAPLVAEDGLVVHFTIRKASGAENSTYANGVLKRLTEAWTFTFPGQYELRLDAKALEAGKENIVVTLKDLSGAKPVYAGSGSATLQIGESQTVAFH